MVVSKKIFPVPERAIVFVLSCLEFRFLSPLVTRLISVRCRRFPVTVDLRLKNVLKIEPLLFASYLSTSVMGNG